jgi:hypothetical protein
VLRSLSVLTAFVVTAPHIASLRAPAFAEGEQEGEQVVGTAKPHSDAGLDVLRLAHDAGLCKRIGDELQEKGNWHRDGP